MSVFFRFFLLTSLAPPSSALLSASSPHPSVRNLPEPSERYRHRDRETRREKDRETDRPARAERGQCVRDRHTRRRSRVHHAQPSYVCPWLQQRALLSFLPLLPLSVSRRVFVLDALQRFLFRGRAHRCLPSPRMPVAQPSSLAVHVAAEVLEAARPAVAAPVQTKDPTSQPQQVRQAQREHARQP